MARILTLAAQSAGWPIGSRADHLSSMGRLSSCLRTGLLIVCTEDSLVSERISNNFLTSTDSFFLFLFGNLGWDKQVWEVEKLEEGPEPSVTLSYLSKDGEEGFPGNVNARVTYTLQGNGELRISYHATTDKPTPINMTNHSYFNLHGQNRSVTDHVLTLNAESFLVCDENVLPTGEIQNVAGSPFDFTQPAPIGKEPGWFEGVRGYDNCFVLRAAKEGELRLAARVQSPDTNIALEVHTTQPGVQFYSSNFFDGTIKVKASHLAGSTSEFYQKQFGLALETQHFPDSPNQPSFPSIIVRPGEAYNHTTLLKISW